ncbi:MAG: hypothetical protein CI948_2064 [Halanaerobium sp.]|nr:MAG: hypothetical protein CI948_2064 [Halanaerobium sp.]
MFDLGNNSSKEIIKNKLLKIGRFYDDNITLDLDDEHNITFKITDSKFTKQNPEILNLMNVSNSFTIKSLKKNEIELTFYLETKVVNNLF